MPNLLDLAYAPLALAALPRLLGKRRGGWGARLGKGPALPPAGRPRLLVCAVSLGEVNLLRPFESAWAGSDLEARADLVIASTTDTGYARAVELFGDRRSVVRYPLDFSWCVRRVLGRVRPDAVALVELELWPNFLAACRRRSVPVAVFNGRLSDRSTPRYRRFGFVTRRWFGGLAAVGAQDERSAARFRELGSPRVETTGNMKWDAAPEPPAALVLELKSRLGLDRGSEPLVVAGSTEPGEPALLDAALPAGARLLVAPRRPEWFEGAAAELPGAARWSRPDTDGGEAGDGRRFVLDALGKLSAAYALADVVVLGRSFGERHGSDPMEPASLGKPVLIGPAHADFRQAVDDLRGAGALSVVTREELGPALRELIEDEAARGRMASAAREASAARRGAAARHLGLARELLGLSEP